MTREHLEKALQKTIEGEEKKMKKIRFAEQAGIIVGTLISAAIDATLIWVVVRYMIGVTSFTWLGGLGALLLLGLVALKLKSDS